MHGQRAAPAYTGAWGRSPLRLQLTDPLIGDHGATLEAESFLSIFIHKHSIAQRMQSSERSVVSRQRKQFCN